MKILNHEIYPVGNHLIRIAVENRDLLEEYSPIGIKQWILCDNVDGRQTKITVSMTRDYEFDDLYDERSKDRIDYLRRAKGMTWNELANRMGCSTNNLHRLRKEKKVYVTTLVKLTSALELNADEIRYLLKQYEEVKGND